MYPLPFGSGKSHDIIYISILFISMLTSTFMGDGLF